MRTKWQRLLNFYSFLDHFNDLLTNLVLPGSLVSLTREDEINALNFATENFSSAGGMWLSRSESLWINTLPRGLKLDKLSPEQTPTQAREEGEFVRETFLCNVILCVAWLMPWFGASISGALQRRRPARDILYNCSDCTKDNSIRDYTANRALTGSSRKTREESNCFPQLQSDVFLRTAAHWGLRTKQWQFSLRNYNSRN